MRVGERSGEMPTTTAQDTENLFSHGDRHGELGNKYSPKGLTAPQGQAEQAACLLIHTEIGAARWFCVCWIGQMLKISDHNGGGLL